MKARVGILVPAFRGGRLLEQTVASCMPAMETSDGIHLFVVDNTSDDGSAQHIQEVFPHSRVHVQINPENLGRIGNWNRCLEFAADAGMDSALFLMVGDELLDGHALMRVAERQKESGALLSCFRFALIDEAGSVVSVTRNWLRNRQGVVPARDFARHGVEDGTLVFGPLQANLYSLDASIPLRFQSDDPSHTDQASTIDFLMANGGEVQLDESVVMGWKIHAGRFHMSMDPLRRMDDDLAMIRNAAVRHGFQPEAATVLAARLLITLQEYVVPRRSLPLAWNLVQFALDRLGRLPSGEMALAVLRKLLLRRSLAGQSWGGR